MMLSVLCALLSPAAQAASPESALRGTRVKIKAKPDSIANHVHSIIAQGRAPLHNIVNVEGGVIRWGYKGTAHEALVDLLAPADAVPFYFSGQLRAEPSAYAAYAETGPLLVAVGEAQFGDEANLIALADPSYRFASIRIVEATLDGEALEPDEDLSQLSDFFGVSAQQWGLDLPGSGTLAVTFEIEWVMRHTTLALPLRADAQASTGDRSVTLTELTTDDEPSLDVSFEFAPQRALGFYVSDRGLVRQSMGYSDTSSYMTFGGTAGEDAEIVFSFPKKTHRETVQLTLDVSLPE